MITITCRRFEQNNIERGTGIIHTKTPEEALGFLIEVDLNFSSNVVASKDSITAQVVMFGITDITTYVGTKEEMEMLHKAAEMYNFIKDTKREENVIACNKAIKRMVGHVPFGDDAPAFMRNIKDILVGQAVARTTCIMLIGAVDAHVNNLGLDKMKIEELIAMVQLVLFHKAKVKDLV